MLFFLAICAALVYSQRTSYSTQPHSATSHQSAHAYTPTSQYAYVPFVPLSDPSHPPTNPSQYVSPSASYCPPDNVPPSAPVQPSANAPSYMSDEPPPYESDLVIHLNES